MGDKITTFTRQSAQRIARAVRQVEGAQASPLRYAGARGAGGGDVYRTLVGKCDAAIDKGNSGTMKLWYGETGATYAEAEENGEPVEVTIYARLFDVPAGVFVYCVE